MASKNHNGTRDPSMIKPIVSAIPKKRQELIKWNGWGYNDSEFEGVNHGIDKDVLKFTGTRYPIGNMELPIFTEWVKQKFNVCIGDRAKERPPPEKYPDSIQVEEFMEVLRRKGFSYSVEGLDRLIRSHGQTLYDIHSLLVGKMNRIPDVVVWPTCHDDVEQLVKLAHEHNVVIIPYGGGTSVSGAITCPENEQRSIVALDTSQMNRLLWLDKSNLVACFEAGVVGQDLERELRTVGLTLGHEPDSFEFSTLGGWVATRASGMKKNVYGNIEDMVVRVKMVTPKGVLERQMSAPRASCGPDFNHVVLGSEGTLGVVTEVLLKVRPVPPVKKYGALVFPDFSSGVQCLREIARRRCQPASIRLMDNEQFQFGQALKPIGSIATRFMDGLKKVLLTRLKGIDLTEMCVTTLVYEGEGVDVAHQEKLVNEIAGRYGGINAGAENGERGYVLTFVIAYIRDLALRFKIVAESFETSVPWDRCEALCENVKERVRRECAAMNITHFLISCRVTQTYDAGACVYFYFGFKYTDHADPVQIYEDIEGYARDECLANGGSISHHHGVGKLRSRWYPQSVSSVGVDLYKATKRELDPRNIFAIGNLLESEHETVVPKAKL